MEQLRVIGSEDEALVLATESGQRFTLAVDAVLRAELKRSHRADDAANRGPRPSPRDIQARVRAGLSSEDVAEALQITVDDVERYAAPVLAEREHMVGQALSVPVLVAGDLDGSPTFGDAVRAKLHDAGAVGERWTSWKEPGGWMLKLEFTASDVAHDARWGFDPRRSTLSPKNADATQLSRQGPLPDGLIPRLRALDTPAPEETPLDLDDGIEFGPRRLLAAAHDAATAPASTTPTSAAVQRAAIKRAPEQSQTSSETADLLEALRRRRGQRSPLPTEQDELTAPVSSPVALFDALEPEPGPEDADAPEHAATQDRRAAAPTDGKRKGRPSMPSWDEIVFGARSDDS
ncbi:septation protein SepH [Microbacterium terrisoli]|uniref:septation protein SepH n=1 Tax=Microbacterium terrisoli TaxID=3242192 RepID=UPI0028062E60|nr:septation protein SepH [Microbacterium protaetiae]